MVINYLSYQKKFLIASLLAITLFSSCIQPVESGDEYTLPEHINNLENLTVYPSDPQPPDTVLLTRETVFESNEDVYMAGRISTFSVDDEDRVYIVSSVPGAVGVYLFHPDGSYQNTIGSFGRGPGEFESVSSIQIWDQHFTLFDPRLQKVAVYSIDDAELMDEVVIQMDQVLESDELPGNARGRDLFVTENGEMILTVHMSSPMEELDRAETFYYSLSRDGIVQPGKLLALDRYKHYFLPEREFFPIAVRMPFTRSSLVAIAGNGSFFTAWTEDFLIRNHDRNGSYLQAFYHSVDKSTLDMNQLDIADHEWSAIRDHEMPETWPALHTMEIDDEGRLWIATITDSDTTYTWWVLHQDGELLARFELPGRRATRLVGSQPEIIIKNGYFYTREVDVMEGINRVVKHRIEFKQR